MKKLIILILLFPILVYSQNEKILLNKYFGLDSTFIEMINSTDTAKIGLKGSELIFRDGDGNELSSSTLDTGFVKTTGTQNTWNRLSHKDLVTFDDTISLTNGVVRTPATGLIIQDATNTAIVMKGGTSSNTTSLNMYYGVSSGRRSVLTQRNTKYGLYLTASNPFSINELNTDADVEINGTESYLLYTDASSNKTGVGTYTPYGKLDVVDSINCFTTNYDSIYMVNTLLRLNTATTNNWGSVLTFGCSDVPGAPGGAAIAFRKTGANNKGELLIGTKSTTTADTEIPVRAIIKEDSLICEAVYVTDTITDDLRLPLVSLNTGGANAPDPETFRGNLISFTFDNSAEEEIFFDAQMSHRYKVGSELIFHVHYSPYDDVTSGDVVIGLEYSWANYDGSVFGAPSTIYDTITISAGDRYKHLLDAFVNRIDGTGKTESSILLGRFFRLVSSPADDYGAPIFIHTIDFHYIVEKLGEKWDW